MCREDDLDDAPAKVSVLGSDRGSPEKSPNATSSTTERGERGERGESALEENECSLSKEAPEAAAGLRACSSVARRALPKRAPSSVERARPSAGATACTQPFLRVAPTAAKGQPRALRNGTVQEDSDTASQSGPGRGRVRLARYGSRKQQHLTSAVPRGATEQRFARGQVAFEARPAQFSIDLPCSCGSSACGAASVCGLSRCVSFSGTALRRARDPTPQLERLTAPAAGGALEEPESVGSSLAWAAILVRLVNKMVPLTTVRSCSQLPIQDAAREGQDAHSHSP